MSDKKEKPWFKKIRKLWERHPSERVKKSDKLYARQKNRKILENEMEEKDKR
jgi:hypothetical protein